MVVHSGDTIPEQVVPFLVGSGLRVVMNAAFFKRTWLLWCGFASLVAGYLLLASGDISAAPLLLVIGYCVCFPLFLWRSFRRESGE